MFTRYQKLSKQKLHACIYCSYKSASIISIEQHVKYHKVDYLQDLFLCTKMSLEPYVCELCQYKTYFIIDWKKHNEFNNHNDIERETESLVIEIKESKPKEVSEIYYCTNCGFQTYSQLVLLRHVYAKCPIKVGIKTYVEIEENTYIEEDKSEVKPTPSSASIDNNCFKCGQCSYRTESNLFYIMHLTAEHTNLPQKDSSSKSSSTLILDKFKTKKDYEQTKYRCNKCTYQTKWKSGLKVHMISRHPKDNIKWYKCKQCSYMTKWKHNLQTHKITKHTKLEDIKWFECEQCPYKAKVGSCLRNHFLSKHTAFRDLKWLHCDKCSHKTRWKSNLKAHIRAKHPSC